MKIRIKKFDEFLNRQDRGFISIPDIFTFAHYNYIIDKKDTWCLLDATEVYVDGKLYYEYSPQPTLVLRWLPEWVEVVEK